MLPITPKHRIDATPLVDQLDPPYSAVRDNRGTLPERCNWHLRCTCKTNGFCV